MRSLTIQQKIKTLKEEYENQMAFLKSTHSLSKRESTRKILRSINREIERLQSIVVSSNREFKQDALYDVSIPVFEQDCCHISFSGIGAVIGEGCYWRSRL